MATATKHRTVKSQSRSKQNVVRQSDEPFLREVSPVPIPATPDPRWAKVDGGFFCLGCLIDCDPNDSSPDPRYCQPCYDFLVGKVNYVKGLGHPEGVMIRGGLVMDLGFEVGDRVQSILTNGVADNWLTILSTIGPSSVVTSAGTFTINEIMSHQKKEENSMKPITTPQENLIKARTTLAKLEGEGADPRVVGLWRSKVAQAEMLASDANATITPATTTLKVTAGPRSGMTLGGAIGAVKMAPAPKPKRSSTAAPCLCGCGLVAPTGRFIQGHDSKFASMIRKLDKGIVTIDQLPQRIQEMVNSNHEAVVRARLHNKV